MRARSSSTKNPGRHDLGAAQDRKSRRTGRRQLRRDGNVRRQSARGLCRPVRDASFGRQPRRGAGEVRGRPRSGTARSAAVRQRRRKRIPRDSASTPRTTRPRASRRPDRCPSSVAKPFLRRRARRSSWAHRARRKRGPPDPAPWGPHGGSRALKYSLQPLSSRWRFACAALWLARRTRPLRRRDAGQVRLHVVPRKSPGIAAITRAARRALRNGAKVGSVSRRLHRELCGLSFRARPGARDCWRGPSRARRINHCDAAPKPTSPAPPLFFPCTTRSLRRSTRSRRAARGRDRSDDSAPARNTASCVSADVPLPTMSRQRSTSARQPSASASRLTSSITCSSSSATVIAPCPRCRRTCRARRSAAPATCSPPRWRA